MRSLEDANKRWHRTTDNVSLLPYLRAHVNLVNGDSVCISGLRSVCWKIFLVFQDSEETKWLEKLQDSRDAYLSLRGHFLRYIEHSDELGTSLDPLDDDQNSPWNTLRQDEELRAEIFLDVERCMPEEQYFRLPETQIMLLDILFIFCKMNLDTSYRQGMHELLAPILWVVEQDAIDLSIDGGSSGDDSSDLMKEILNSKFVEHDAFTMFTIIMRTAKSFYELGEPDRRSSIGSRQSLRNGASPIVERSKRIHEVLLAQVDLELAAHLTQIEILPQIFLIRWIRLLFGREFPFDDLLCLWDTLFAEDINLDLVDMICVAMLLRIRWQLLDADYSVALTLLLKYPAPLSPDGPQTFVDDALLLKKELSPSGGAKIILKYSGRAPASYSSNLRPTTPIGKIGHEPRRPQRKSPLPSPGRFLQQQGGIEAILQGAAKGAFERSEKLGINQAVRDAVGEVRKNMQGLQTQAASDRKNFDVERRSLDEGRAVPSPNRTVSAMEQRNKKLSELLGEALVDLRRYSKVSDESARNDLEAIDLAIAKLQFIQVYLEDSSIPLPPEPTPDVTTSETLLGNESRAEPQAAVEKSTGPNQLPLPTLPTEVSKPTPEGRPNIGINGVIGSMSEGPQEALPATEASTFPSVDAATEIPSRPARQIARVPARPTPIPTRSTLAQSSFAFMLEPDEASEHSVKSASPPKGGSSFLASSRRSVGGASRNKAAFLFGDEPEDTESPSGKPPLVAESSDIIDLESLRRQRWK